MSFKVLCELRLFPSAACGAVPEKLNINGKKRPSSAELSFHLKRKAKNIMARSIFKSDDAVVKSPNDRRLYRVIELENGLCALLIHDPDIYSDESHEDPDALENGVEVNQMKEEFAEEAEEEDDDDDDEGEDDDEEEGEDDDEDEEDGGGDSVEEETDFEGSRRGGHSCSSSVQTKKAAAAMCVGMGSFSDPDEAQGLAHFLEHMLFMGSAEFPDENEYDSYLSKHGGSSNAYTEAEHTCYHFEVKREALRGALKRFAQFFISPLVKMDAMEREVLAVDSEFNQVMQNDSCRLQQLQCHTSVTGHPFHRFSWGNKKSLADAMEKGVDLRDHILQLYRDWYHGGLMKLCVIGGESLDVLESWVSEMFASVRKGVLARPKFEVDGPIWEAGMLYRLEAVKENHTLELSWTLPCLRKDYLKKSQDYLAHLLGHEGKGSLLSFLKSKGWAMFLSAGVGNEGMHKSSVAYIFGMSIRLTDLGLEKVFNIIDYVYQYVKLIRNASPQEWIFKELQDIGNMEFKFSEDQSQDDYAAELAENMFLYPTRHIIYGDYAYEIWDAELIKYVLGFLCPDNMRIDVVSKSHPNFNDVEFEPWFGSRYVKECIPKYLMDKWNDPLEIDSSLHLPLCNDFIPHDFSICADNMNVVVESSFPRCIVDEPLMKVWYKLDQNFKLPRANAYFRINLKGGYANAKSSVLTELFILLLKDELNEILYQASVAKLETAVSLVGDKLELKVYGFNEKVAVLMSKILQVAKSFSPTEDRFKVIKEDLERSLKNANMKPLSHASYLRLQVLCKTFYEVEEKLSILDDLCLSDLQAFIPQLRSQVHIVGFCHGNLTEQEAQGISSLFKSNWSSEAVPHSKRHYEQVLNINFGTKLARDVDVKNKSEKNSVLELYFQIMPDSSSESISLKAILDLFNDIVEEPLFNQLRTKEQLGYVVECSPRVTYRVYGFCFCVQSSEYSPVYLQERVNNFIHGLRQLLEDLDEVSFENYKRGLAAKLLEKDPSLQHETNRHWSQIVDERYIFDFPQREVEKLETIKKSDVISLYNTYLQPSSPKCRSLAIRVWGCNTQPNSGGPYTDSETLIKDIVSFKASSEFYPNLTEAGYLH